MANWSIMESYIVHGCIISTFSRSTIVREIIKIMVHKEKTLEKRVAHYKNLQKTIGLEAFLLHINDVYLIDARGKTSPGLSRIADYRSKWQEFFPYFTLVIAQLTLTHRVRSVSKIIRKQGTNMIADTVSSGE